MNITKIMLVSFITNILLTILKIIFGLLGKCSSLIADGIHSLSDLLTDLVAIIGNKLSLKPEDTKHPFGHGKLEYVTSIFIGILILLLGFNMIKHSFNKEITIPNNLVMLVSLFTIITKYILSNYIYKNGVKYKNNILIASGKESKSDVYSSIFVLISIILMQFSNTLPFLKYCDIIGTIIISLFIIKTGISILKENIFILLEEQITDTEYIDNIKKIILKYKDIIEIKELHILRYGPYYKLNATVIMNNILLKDAHSVIDKIENKLKKYDDKIKYVIIHMETN